MLLTIDRIDSPVGVVLLVSDEQKRVRALDYEDHEERMHHLLDTHYGPKSYTLKTGSAPPEIVVRLQSYFEGQLTALGGIDVACEGTTFQKAVWTALRRIPIGTTRSYGELAAMIGRADAARAVGAANGTNPIAIIVPCHRVVGASGRLTGYAGGLDRKAWLLAHERSCYKYN